MREQFEAAMLERWPEMDLERHGEDYRNTAAKWAWFGWEAFWQSLTFEAKEEA